MSDYLFEGTWSDDSSLPFWVGFILLGVLPELKCAVHGQLLEKKFCNVKRY